MLAGIIAVLFVIETDAKKTKCRFSKKKLKTKIKNFDSCIARGFESSLTGCSTDADNQLKKKEARKCGQLEKYLHKCGHVCEAGESYRLERCKDGVHLPVGGVVRAG